MRFFRGDVEYHQDFTCGACKHHFDPPESWEDSGPPNYPIHCPECGALVAMHNAGAPAAPRRPTVAERARELGLRLISGWRK